jgi:S-adenosylmethionine hydrolase
MLRRIAASTVVALSLLSAGAFAYWSNAGEANASASLATLSAPTISSATAGAGTVALTWSAVTPPAGATVEYYVTRDGGAPSGGCPSSSSPSTATSCTDTGVSIGAHAYTVTAVWRTWTATSTVKSATVAFGPTTHFQIQAASTTPTAGETDNLTITAKDEYGNTTTTFAGKKTLTFSEPASSPSGKVPSYPATVTFTAGVGTAAVKLCDAQATTVKGKEGTLEGTSPSLTVKAAATKKLSVPTPSEQEAGVAFNVTLTATDEYGNLTTSYTGAKTLAWSGPANSPSGQTPEYPTSATAVTFTAGVGTASQVKLYDAQSPTLTAKEGAIEGTTPASFTVKAAGAISFSVPTPTEREAGVAFNEIVTAWDTWHNTAKSFAGAKTLIWSGPSSSPSGQVPSYPATVTFSEGTGTASITLYDAQGTALVAKEGTLEGSSNTFTVKAAAAKKFIVPAPSEQEAGVAFNVTLTATDEWGNPAKSYTGSKTLAWSGPASSPGGTAAEYPTTATAVTFSEGLGTASGIKLFDAQSTALTAKSKTVEGTSNSITVRAAAAERLAWSRPEVSAGSIKAGTCPFACVTASIGHSETFSAYVSVTDAWGNVVSNVGATTKEKVEKTSGAGTLMNATGLTIPTSGPAESSIEVEYTSPASGTSEAILKLKVEEGAAYTEAEAHVKY